MMEMKRLNEIFNHSLDLTGQAGFFHYLDTWALANQIEIPWLEDSTMSDKLDLLYHGNHSGMKFVSPLVANLSGNQPINDSRAMLIAGTWYSTYAENLNRLWEVMLSEYDPITNYSMTESGSDAKSGDDTLTYSGTETLTKQGYESTIKQGEEYTGKTGHEKQTKHGFEVKNVSSDTSDNGFGFNTTAENGTPVKKTNTKGKEVTGFTYTPEGGTSTDRYDEIEFTERKDTTSFGIIENGVDKRRIDTTSFGLDFDPLAGGIDTRRKDTITFSGRNDKTQYNSTVTHSLTKSGNIGVTTSQQMLESEIALWKWNFFVDYVFPCVDTTLTIPIY